MEHELNDLMHVWQQAKQHQPDSAATAGELIAQAKSKKMKVYAGHYGNLIVLNATTILLAIFFYLLNTLQDLISMIGISLMIGGLLVRTGIEVMSLIRAIKIKVDQPTTHSLSELLSFHRLRKKIHGPVTTILVLLYVIGLYAITPEVGRHLSTQSFWAMHISIPLLAMFLLVVGRWGIGEEMKALNRLLEMQHKLNP